MGVVYLGADPEGRHVAIKVLRPAVAGDATARRRLAREVDSMRRVHSPHVAEILDADVTAEQPYIVTQYVPGRTLEEVVEESGSVEGTDLQTLAVGLASALSAIHGAGIVHRDLKPANVMMMDGGEPVVIDFGIAQAADATRLTATGMVIGTPGYLAPEIIEGHEAGPHSDVHAWAGTLAYAATGRAPFGSGTFEAIFYKIMSGKPDLDGVPAPILPVLRAAIARDPSERPKAVDLVQLTRRLHFDSTVTDQTRVDRHYPAGASGDDPDQAGQFGMPSAATGEGAGRTATPPPMPTPAPVHAQPSDFVGQLPPAAPPPAPPPPEYRRDQYGGQGQYGRPYPPQEQYPEQYPPRNQLQRRPPEQPPQHDPRTAPRPGDRRDERTRDEREARKPYGWYRIISFLVLIALLGFANIAPLLAVVVTLGGVLVLRMADKAAKGMEGRQTRRGPRSGDAVAAAFRTPLHLPGALTMTVLLSALSLLAGLVLLAILIFADPGMAASRAIAWSAMLVIALMSLAPGSGASRRQLARVWGALMPRAEAALIGALIIGIFAAVLVGLSRQQPPDTTPLDGMSQNLESLRSDVHDLVSGIPFV
ncbi:serine/threonine protein kinase [Actinomadura algeriensis]|uniref:Serine/threonine protein kinase n=2 Tax=Actinomadura algeriensis TaxID=1679523 RepID=A0ABR9JVL3_9ACTN|nr:serine/threonine protein kinase [Actinomadura algeriensis]